MSDMPEKWAIEGFLSQLPSRIAERIIADKIAGLAVDLDTQEFIIAGARIYAALNKAPEDLALDMMREAVAAFLAEDSAPMRRRNLLDEKCDGAVKAALASIRAQGFDIVKVGSAQ